MNYEEQTKRHQKRQYITYALGLLFIAVVLVLIPTIKQQVYGVYYLIAFIAALASIDQFIKWHRK